MDLERVLRAVLERLRGRDVRFAAIGGVGLGLWGVQRSTVDLDFLVHQDDLPRWDEALSSLGYRLDFRSENASRHVHAATDWGCVDALHAFRPISLGMLDRARAAATPDAALSVPVVEPEDLIGLKLQALANDPERFHRECADIEALARFRADSLDWNRVREYHLLFGKESLYEDLRRRLGLPHEARA